MERTIVDICSGLQILGFLALSVNPFSFPEFRGRSLVLTGIWIMVGLAGIAGVTKYFLPSAWEVHAWMHPYVGVAAVGWMLFAIWGLMIQKLGRDVWWKRFYVL